MKSKISKILTLLLMFCLSLTLCFAFGACDKTIDELQNEYGVFIEGEFAEGAQIVFEKVENEEKAEVIEKIAEQKYNKDAEVLVYDISVVKDNAEIQPNGKVKVSIPVENIDASKVYIVMHVKDNGSVEILTPTVSDGRVSFETDSFSYFVLAEHAHEWSEMMHPVFDVETGEETDYHASHCNVCGIEGAFEKHETSASCAIMVANCDKCGVQMGRGNHSFDDSIIMYVDETKHAQHCLTCGEAIEEAHYGGEAATCGEPTCCDGCQMPYGEVPPHVEREDWIVEDYVHIKACENCGLHMQVENHTYDNGEADGNTVTYTCTVCGHTKSHTHEWSSWTFDDEQSTTQHYRECDCEAKEWANHSFGEWTPVIGTTVNESEQHQRTCECGKAEYANHQWDNGVEGKDDAGADATVYTCATCQQKKYEYPCSHQLTDWMFDGENLVQHYRKCELCGEAKEWANHEFEGDYESFGEEGHVQLCTVCQKGHSEPVAHSGGTATCMMQAKCDVCQEPYGDVDENNHSFGEWEPVYGTTVESNDKHQRTCECGEVEYANHEWDNGVHGKYADGSDGAMIFTCAVCDATKYEEADENHSYGAWEADATNSANHSRFCACGASESKAHDFDEGVLGKFPENYPAGGAALIYTCATCEYVKYEATECPHDYTNAKGYAAQLGHVLICNICGEGKGFEEPHTYGEGVAGMYPDGSEGAIIYTCTACDHTKYTAADHTHVYGEWESLSGSVMPGYHYRRCECGDTEYAKHTLPEEWDQGSENGHFKYCTTCGENVWGVHEYGDPIEFTDNSGAVGTYTECAVCQFRRYKYGDDHVHTYGEYEMTEVGHARRCEECGYCDSGEHSYPEDATCEDAVTCSVCSYETTLAHDWAEYMLNEVTEGLASTHTATCSKCGDSKSENCTFEGAWSAGSVDGHIRNCIYCQKGMQQEAHVWAEETKEGTTEEGYAATVYTCTVCENEFAIHTHVWSEDWDLSEEGYHYKVCACGDVSEYGEHEAGDWQPSGDGHVQSCIVCEAVLANEIHHYFQEFDDTKHYELCVVCNYVTNGVDHVIVTGEGCLQAYCEGCQYKVIDRTKEHNWTTEAVAQYDEEGNPIGHLYVCIDCEMESELEDCYSSSGNCQDQGPCDKCQESAKGGHVLNGILGQNESVHSGVCTLCGETVTEAHYGGEATCQQAGQCEVCMVQYLFVDHQLVEETLDGVEQYRCIACGQTIAKDATITVNFTYFEAEVGTITVNGTVSSSEYTTDEFAVGATVTFSVTMEEGWAFRGWYVDGRRVSSDTTYTLTVGMDDVLVVAEFYSTVFSPVSVHSSDIAYGTVWVNDVEYTEDFSGEFDNGETVTVKAVAKDGFVFSHWLINEITVEEAEEYTFTVTEDTHLIAVFEPAV